MTLFERLVQEKFRIDAPYFLRGGFWLLLSQAVTIIGGIGVSALFAFMLTEHEYGIYRYIIGIGVLLSAFSLSGLGQSVLQTAAKKYRQFYRDSIKIGLIYSIGITVSALAGASYYFYQGNTTLTWGCLIIALFQPLINSFQNIFSFLQGRRKFRASTTSQAIKTITVSVASIGAVLFTQDIIILLFVYFFSHTFTNVVFHLYYQPKIELPLTAEIKNKYVTYAKQTSIRNAISGVAFRLDTIIIFQQLGAVELAVYAIANIIPEQIKASFKNITSLLIPKFIQNDQSHYSKNFILKRSLQLFLILSSITLVFILIAPFIYTLLFPKYEEAILYSQLLALSFPALILFIPLSLLQAKHEDSYLHKITLYGSLLEIVILFTLTTSFGLIGAIVSKIISRYLNLILYFYYSFKSLKT